MSDMTLVTGIICGSHRVIKKNFNFGCATCLRWKMPTAFLDAWCFVLALALGWLLLATT